MLHPLLSIAAQHSHSDNNVLLIAVLSASLLVLQKRKGIKYWLLRLWAKKMIKRSKKGRNGFTNFLLGLLVVAALTALLSLLVGWSWAIVIAVLTLLYLGASKNKERTPDF